MKLSQFFEKINKVNKILPRLIKKMERTQINVSHKRISYNGYQRNRKDFETTILSQATIANKLYNLEKMDKFLGRYNLPRPKQRETENMKRQITSTEIETVI